MKEVRGVYGGISGIGSSRVVGGELYLGSSGKKQRKKLVVIHDDDGDDTATTGVVIMNIASVLCVSSC